MSDEFDLFDDLEEEAETPYLLFSVGKRLFAVEALQTREMVKLPETVPVPEQAPWVRGIMSLREKTYRVIDFRKRIGMKGSREEISDLAEELDKREAEHKQWLKALEESLANGSEFTGEEDPHQCGFGRWYDHYKSDNVNVTIELKKFEAPHQLIHETAHQVLSLKQKGKKEEAITLIKQRREGELAKMIELFESLKATLFSTLREIAIIIDSETHPSAICVDTVVSVEPLEKAASAEFVFAQDKASSLSRNAVIGKRLGGEELVLILDPEWILNETENSDRTFR